MDFLLTEEQQLIGQAAREFAREALDPLAAALDHDGAYPAAAVEALAGQDFLGLFLPGAYGGAEAGFVSLVEVLEALAGSSAAVAAILAGHALAAYAVDRWGTEPQKRTWLPRLAKGEVLGAAALGEHGPNPLMAVQHPEGWVLNGTKGYVRNAGPAGLIVVAAATGEKTTSLFLVEAGAAGLEVGTPAEPMGLRGCPVADLAFSDVVLAETALLGAPDGGAALLADLAALAALVHGAQTVGIGSAAVAHAAAYAKTRVQFGRPIAALEAIQTLLAEAATDCHLGRLALRSAARLLDEGQPFQVEAAMAQQFLGRMGSRILQDTVQVEGGFGYSEFMPLPRLFRDIAGTTLRDAPADLPEAVIAASLLA
ncbi:acyl-CoA dehydrogenase family protein [Mesoterricola sediminis]|uniref:Acyl-CoA dehydrogenase n=1 Tax=Mesoterricola sediminis TaxID=2927980 RepID=A0AA48HHK9_9BACT|nr:acyl-CoA dehydrogenase family protein [Mesoterricola sediminis]BDU78363.1 hypothetical protein METESE_33210 [Mesoterricola sediminis]